MTEWENELERWLKPFLDRLGHKTRQRMCPLYVAGLIGPGDRKSARRVTGRTKLLECLENRFGKVHASHAVAARR
jgi:hypothetical protein